MKKMRCGRWDWLASRCVRLNVIKQTGRTMMPALRWADAGVTALKDEHTMGIDAMAVAYPLPAP
jgi:hypothetical protein